VRAAPLLLLALLAAGSAQAAVTVRVDISRQAMDVAASTGESFHWPISTGRVGYRTPNGTYRPQRLELFWRSRKYGNAPMPHSIFFRGGYAIHGTTETRRLGRPASHGCIRLHPRNAATLCGLVRRHSMAATRIIITGSRPELRRSPPRPRMQRGPRLREPIWYAPSEGAWPSPYDALPWPGYYYGR
jgi:lipoprotein-anchoring transpeptidase ErfK/SrfK